MPPAIDLARRYAEALAALRAVHDFDDWLGQFWEERCTVPEGGPAARTPLGVEGAIAWYDCGETIAGYVPRQDGCFRVPRSAALPVFPFVADELVAPTGQDVVISAAMRDELHPPGG
jgi:hypothetical protein